MQQTNHLRLDDSDPGRRAYARRYQHALQGWVASRMRRQAQQRRRVEVAARRVARRAASENAATFTDP